VYFVFGRATPYTGIDLSQQDVQGTGFSILGPQVCILSLPREA
jgi:hypothetical protein